MFGTHPPYHGCVLLAQIDICVVIPFSKTTVVDSGWFILQHYVIWNDKSPSWSTAKGPFSCRMPQCMAWVVPPEMRSLLENYPHFTFASVGLEWLVSQYWGVPLHAWEPGRNTRNCHWKWREAWIDGRKQMLILVVVLCLTGTFVAGQTCFWTKILLYNLLTPHRYLYVLWALL